MSKHLIVPTCKIWSCRQALYRKSWDKFWRTRFSQPPEVQCLLSPRLRRFVWCFLAKQAPMRVWDETECKKISSWYKCGQHFLFFASSKEIRNEISKFWQCLLSFGDMLYCSSSNNEMISRIAESALLQSRAQSSPAPRSARTLGSRLALLFKIIFYDNCRNCSLLNCSMHVLIG